MGRPRKEINWLEVEKLCQLQCTQEEIAWFCDVSLDTIERHCLIEFEATFAEYYKQKKGVGKIALRKAQWQSAIGGNVTMQIWLGKQLIGQTEPRDQSSTDQSKNTRTIMLKYHLEDTE